MADNYFDPVEGDPLLAPQERVRRGFQALRVDDRSKFPDPTGGFLAGPGPFDPYSKYELPSTAGWSPAQNRQATSEDLFNPLAQKLGIIDVQHMQTERLKQLVREIQEMRKREASGVK